MVVNVLTSFEYAPIENARLSTLALYGIQNIIDFDDIFKTLLDNKTILPRCCLLPIKLP